MSETRASQDTPVVGFIGLGDQGLPMARAIAGAGFPLHVWARRPASLEALAGVPHEAAGSVEALAAVCDVVALCVGTDEDVERLVGQMLPHLREGAVVVNTAPASRPPPPVWPSGARPGVSRYWTPRSAVDARRPRRSA